MKTGIPKTNFVKYVQKQHVRETDSIKIVSPKHQEIIP